MFCKYCGKEMPDHAEFCSFCGAQLRDKADGSAPKAVPTPPVNDERTQPIPQWSEAPRRAPSGLIIGLVVALVALAGIGGYALFSQEKHSAEVQELNQELYDANKTAEEEKQKQAEEAEAAQKAAEKAAKEAEKKQKDAEEEAEKAKEAARKAEKEKAEAEEKAAQQAARQAQQQQQQQESSSAGTTESTKGKSSGSDWPTNSKLITTSDLQSMSRSKVATVRNEMYARHGYYFTSASWREYFSKRSWYKPEQGVDMSTIQARFNSYETKNLSTIMKYESEKGWR